MVTRETRYIGQLYFGLSTDDPADIAEWHNGDRILLMDQDQMMVYDEDTFDFKPISMDGGGGGGGSTIVSKTITANDTYYASADNADGYNPIIVNVPAQPVQYENFVFTLHNALGGYVTFVSTFYDSDNDELTLFIYASQTVGSEVQKTCLIQEGKVQLALVTNQSVGSVTYNGQPLNATITGSGTRRYIKFEIPDPFDPTIPIYFNT